MLAIKDPTTVPPGGWQYTQPGTGTRLTAVTLALLCQKVSGYRAANGLPTERDLSEEIQEAICLRLGEGSRVHHCRDLASPRVRATVGWKQVAAFGRTLMAWLSDPHWVPQEEAERRAAICAGCPHNVPAHGCAPCRDFVSSVAGKLGGRTTKCDEALRNCGICGCINKVQVHVPLSALQFGITKGFPEWCWKTA